MAAVIWTMVKFQHGYFGREVPISAQMLAKNLFPTQSLPSGLIESPQDMADCLAQSKKAKNDSGKGVAPCLTPALQVHSQFCSKFTGKMTQTLLESVKNRISYMC